MQREPQDCSTAREAAKDFLRSFYKERELSVKQIVKQPMSISSDIYDAQVIGATSGVVIDDQGKMHQIDPCHLVMMRVGNLPCFAVFSLAEIIEEIHDEARGYYQGSLASVFAEAQDSPEKRRRPVIYRSYWAGYCQNPACRADLGIIETDGGRDRRYCNDKCRVAAFRARHREEKRAAILQYNSGLRQYWQEKGIRGETLAKLQNILVEHGKAAARAATDAVLTALEADHRAGASEQARLIEEVMLGGERLGFEEVNVEEFYIPAGVEGWLEFVHRANINLLRQLCGYIYDREHQAQRSAMARKRLEALGTQHKGGNERV